MPKAFTCLCEKINISLYDDTLTIYPKQTRARFCLPVLNQLTLFSSLSKFNINARVNNFFRLQLSEFDIQRFIRRDEENHYLYHQDDFNIDEPHYHVQFKTAIDEPMLKSILGKLEKYSLITPKEHLNFMSAYHKANKFPRDFIASEENEVNLLNKFSVFKKQPIQVSVREFSAKLKYLNRTNKITPEGSSCNYFSATY